MAIVAVRHAMKNEKDSSLLNFRFTPVGNFLPMAEILKIKENTISLLFSLFTYTLTHTITSIQKIRNLMFKRVVF
ncbi:hypothetical protein LguiB_028063 [Lonicera macranthoides]